MEEREAIRTLLELGDLPTAEKIQEILKNSIEVPVQKSKLEDSEARVEIVQDHNFYPKKIELRDFICHFKSKYDFIKNLLINRAEVENAISIDKINLTNDKVTIIAAIADIQKLATGTLKLTLEDPTGKMTAIVSAKNEELIKNAGFLTLDEIAGFKGSARKDIFFVNEIIWPDVPHKKMEYSPDEAYALFSGDLHIGSNCFLANKFEKMINWLNGKIGNDRQREIAKKTKYIFLAGDIVDGVGIYPQQEKELEIQSIYKQYDMAAKYLSQIPDDKKIIIVPGNHDAVRICEPQPQLYKDIAAPLYELPNVINLGNPSMVNIHKQDGFSGLNVLIYHGYSFDYFVDRVDALRELGGYDRSEKILSFLLKKRHLAPTYGSTLHLPMPDDPLLIKSVPDIITAGHIHKAKIGNYKHVQLMVTAGFQAKTSFQEKVGHNPEPGKAPLLNLHTRKATMLSF
jgi:DNA polymerase II small subunit